MKQLIVKNLSVLLALFVLFSWGITFLLEKVLASNSVIIWLPLILLHLAAGIYFGIIIRRLHKRACTDSLTGLVNRKYLYELLAQEIGRVKRTGAPFSFLIIDVDNFKQINDSFGHLVGDEVLVKLTGILRQNSRTIDVVARWGGEEFVIALPETSLNGARIFAERLRHQIEIDNTEMGITISLGVAVFRPEYSLDEFVAIADDVLRRSIHPGSQNAVYQGRK